jgi:thiamine pyrophosphate-dependent acetolactate synthase large subunit-like protein
MRHYRKLFGCAPAPDSPILDIVSPPIEFTDLARGFGVPACKVAHPGEIRSAVQDACRTEGPYLLEIQIEA